MSPKVAGTWACFPSGRAVRATAHWQRSLVWMKKPSSAGGKSLKRIWRMNPSIGNAGKGAGDRAPKKRPGVRADVTGHRLAAYSRRSHAGSQVAQLRLDRYSRTSGCTRSWGQPASDQPLAEAERLFTESQCQATRKPVTSRSGSTI